MSSSKITTNQFHHRSLSPHPTRITTRSTSPTFRLAPLASTTTTTKADNNGQNQTISHKTYSLNNNDSGRKKKTCSCSPTTHPGSYICSLHKGNKLNDQKHSSSSSYRPNCQLNMRRSAMTNSLVRIGAVEGEFVKRAPAAMIRPNSRSLRRRFDFQPTKSRLSVMSKAEEEVCIEEEAELSRIV